MPNKVIVVSQELKDLMDKFNGNENWSEVARDSFTKRVEYWTLVQSGKPDAASIARLRAERDESDEYGHAEGLVNGRTWGQAAPYQQLRRVAAIDLADISEDQAREKLGLAMSGEKNASTLDWTKVRDEWQPHIGERYPLLGRIKGFVEGARQVYDLVNSDEQLS